VPSGSFRSTPTSCGSGTAPAAGTNSTNILTTSGNLANKTNTSGWFDFDDLSLGSPASGTGTQCWVYLDTGTSATSPLVYYFDEDEAGSPISIVADGTAINFVVPSGGLFRV
jgi:hypothetical protein